MANRFFLSHAHADSRLADVLAKTLKRISLGQIDVWFSSDRDATGGLGPGVFIDQIRQRLDQSKAIILLLTKESINRPWLLFEAGYAAANKGCQVIPIAVGIEPISSVPFPIGMYQIYQITDYPSLREALQRILTLYDIHFDEKMCRPIVAECISEVVQHQASCSNQKCPEKGEGDSKRSLDDLKAHFDKRLLDLANALSVRETATSRDLISFSVPLRINMPDLKMLDSITIERDDTVETVLNNVYFMISSQVEAFSYLEEWILTETTNDTRLVLREIASRIPAALVFAPDTRWIVTSLSKPYDVTDSKDRILGSSFSFGVAPTSSDTESVQPGQRRKLQEE